MRARPAQQPPQCGCNPRDVAWPEAGLCGGCANPQSVASDQAFLASGDCATALSMTFMRPSMKFAPCIMLLLLLQTMACCTAAAAEGTLQRIKDTQKIRLGYFEGSAPFSFTGSDKSPQGYSVDLCERVTKGIQRQLGLHRVRIVWVPLELKDRIEAIRKGRIDIECGTTTWSFTRQKLVDFSLITFVDGASLLATNDSGIKRISDVEGKRVAVIRGTTTERALAAALVKDNIKAQIIPI